MIKKWSYYLGLVVLVAFLSLGFKSAELKKYDWFHVDENSTLECIVPSEDEIHFINFGFPFTGKSYTGFKQAVAIRESQGRYELVNTFGYMGKYQFGVAALKAIGIYNTTTFLSNPSLQEKAFKALLSKNKWELRKEIEKFEGKIINGVKVTESGILAAAHLGGAGSVKRYLRSNGQKKFRDGFGTSIVSYMEKFGGYDTSNIVPNSKAKVKIN